MLLVFRIFQADVHMDTVGPEIDILLGGQIAAASPSVSSLRHYKAQTSTEAFGQHWPNLSGKEQILQQTVQRNKTDNRLESDRC